MSCITGHVLYINIHSFPTRRSSDLYTRQQPKLLPKRRFSMSMLQTFIATVLALAVTTGGAAYAANSSNPGDVLHGLDLDRKSTRLNSSHLVISYAVFCLKKKKKKNT